VKEGSNVHLKIVRLTLRATSALFLGAAATIALWQGPAGATTPRRTAWWNLTPAGSVPATPVSPPVPSTTLPLAPTTTVPPATPSTVASAVPATPSAGSLEVGFDGSATTAMAAVEYDVPLTQFGQAIEPSSITGLLVLTLVKGGTVGKPVLLACPTTTAWKPGPDQPAKRAPKYNCARHHAAKGSYNASSGTVTWSLSSLQEGRPGVFSLVIVPAPHLARSAAFQATFSAPDDNSFQVLSWQPAGGQPSGGGYQPPPPAPVAQPAPQPASSPASSGSSAFSVSSPTPPTLNTGSPAGVPANPSAVPPSSAPQSFSLGPTRTTALHSPVSKAARDVGIGLLAALGLAAAAASGRRARDPRLLVPVPVPAGAKRPS
jgi:hypothetical protein